MHTALAIGGMAFGLIMVTWSVWDSHKRHNALMKRYSDMQLALIRLQRKIDAIEGRAKKWQHRDPAAWQCVLDIIEGKK